MGSEAVGYAFHGLGQAPHHCRYSGLQVPDDVRQKNGVRFSVGSAAAPTTNSGSDISSGASSLGRRPA
jgi:hypothetical protein